MIIIFCEASSPLLNAMPCDWNSDGKHSTWSSYCRRVVENWRQCSWSVTAEEGPQTEPFPRVTERCIPGSLTQLRSICRSTVCVYPLVTACSWVRNGRRREPNHVWKPERFATRPGVRLHSVNLTQNLSQNLLFFKLHMQLDIALPAQLFFGSRQLHLCLVILTNGPVPLSPFQCRL